MGSINKSHNEADGGVLLFNGELILLYCDSVNCEIGGKESIKGRIFLTTHRLVIIVTPYRQNAPVKSVCAPFCAIIKCSVEQPVFGANYIEATVRDETDSSKSFSFKLKFSKGGAIEMAYAINRAVAATGRNFNPATPPSAAYNPSPSAQYYQAPPTSFAPAYAATAGINLPTQQFPDAPPIGFIYASEAPPPYPGLGPQQVPQQQQQGGGGQNPYYPNYPSSQPGYPQQQPPNYPSMGQQSGYPQAQQQNQQQPSPIYPGMGQQAGYQQAPQPTPSYPAMGQQSGYQQAPQQQQQQNPYNVVDSPYGNNYPQPSSYLNQPQYPDLTQQSNQSPSAPPFNPNWQDKKSA